MRRQTPSSLPSARRMRSLEKTLAYEQPSIAYKFMERYRLAERQAHDVFVETKRFLWLCARAAVLRSAPTSLTIIGLPQMTVIDEMWHTFVLFTPVYASFCEEYFGFFIHHMPATRSDRDESARMRAHDAEAFARSRLLEFRQQAAFVGSELGPLTVRKWFRTYGKRYSPEQLGYLTITHGTPPRATAAESLVPRTPGRRARAR